MVGRLGIDAATVVAAPPEGQDEVTKTLFVNPIAAQEEGVVKGMSRGDVQHQRVDYARRNDYRVEVYTSTEDLLPEVALLAISLAVPPRRLSPRALLMRVSLPPPPCRVSAPLPPHCGRIAK